MDKYSGDLGESLCTITSMVDPVRGGSVGATAVLSPVAGPAKRRVVVHCMAGRTKAGVNKELVGFMLRAHSG